MTRRYRLYVQLVGKVYLRTGWKIAYSNTEVPRFKTVIDSHFDYHFRGRPKLIVREW